VNLSKLHPENEPVSFPFPGLPQIPDLPHHDPANSSVDQILWQADGALQAASWAARELESTKVKQLQLSLIRWTVIECRRSTLVLQKLSSRVENWHSWWKMHQDNMRSDPLMGYFHQLRNIIEKEGLPAAMAELLYIPHDKLVGTVSISEHTGGVMSTGYIYRDENGVVIPADTDYVDEDFLHRNFHLINPPKSHLGSDISDFRFKALADLAIQYLSEQVIAPACEQFGDTQNPL